MRRNEQPPELRQEGPRGGVLPGQRLDGRECEQASRRIYVGMVLPLSKRLRDSLNLAAGVLLPRERTRHTTPQTGHSGLQSKLHSSALGLQSLVSIWFTIFAKAVAEPEWEGTSAGDVGAVTHRPVRTKAARGCSNMVTHRPVRTAPPKRSPPSGLPYHQAPNLKWVSRATMGSLTVPAFLCTRDDPNSSADSSRIQQSGEHKTHL